MLWGISNLKVKWVFWRYGWYHCFRVFFSNWQWLGSSSRRLRRLLASESCRWTSSRRPRPWNPISVLEMEEDWFTTSVITFETEIVSLNVVLLIIILPVLGNETLDCHPHENLTLITFREPGFCWGQELWSRGMSSKVCKTDLFKQEVLNSRKLTSRDKVFS